MEILGLLLMVVGGVIALAGGIWFLVVAFQESILWGLGCMFVPFVSLIFLVMNWDQAAKPFGVNLLGGVILVIGMFLGGGMEGGAEI
jgi:hypothetical protein